jgi:hypothetical protein
MKDFFKRYFLLAAMAAYVFLAVASLVGGELGISERQRRESAEPVVHTEETAPPELYKIGISGGRIAVYSLSDGALLRRTETQASLLPKEDRERLEQGITVEGRRNLRKTLEDICS